MSKHLRLLLCLVACCFCFSGPVLAQGGIVPTVDHITGLSAFVHWDGEEGASYVVSVAHADGYDWTDWTVGEPFVLLNDLDPNTAYKVKVRVLDDMTGSGGVVPFATTCASISGTVSVGDRSYLMEYFPFDTYYDYSITQQLYTADEYGGTPKVLDSLVFFLAEGANVDVTLKIYLGLVSRSYFTGSNDVVGSDSLTLVFDGSVPLSQYANGSRVAIALDSPFALDGVNTLAVVVNNLTGQWVSPQSTFYVHEAPNGETRALAGFRDGSPFVLDAISALSTSTYVCDIEFPGMCSEPACHKRNLVAASVGQTSARMIWTSGCGNDATVFSDVEFEFRRVGEDLWTEVFVSGNEQMLTGLMPNTAYEARVRSLCASDSSAWTVERFHTTLPRMDIIYVKTASAGAGDGSSWSNATSDLAAALDLAASNVRMFDNNPQVWVAEGSYTSSLVAGGAAFRVAPGVSVYGGFAGNEAADYDLSLRHIANLTSTLLGGSDECSVLDIEGSASHLALVDGFTISEGSSSEVGGVNMHAYSRLSNCHVDNCYGDRAGGILINGYDGSDVPTVVVDRCMVTNNSSSHSGAIDVSYGIVTNCLVANNQSVYDAAIGSGNGGAVVRNSTIVNNLTVNSYSSASAVYSWSDFVFENNIAWGNRIEYGDSVQVMLGDDNLIKNNAIEGQSLGLNCINLSSNNTGSVFSPCFEMPTSETGLYFNVYGNWHLTAQSICINRGRTVGDYTGVLDLAGEARMQADTVDLGCYESSYTNTAAAHFGPHVYVVPNTPGLVTTGAGDSWANACTDLSEACTLASALGIDVWMAQGEYVLDESLDAYNIYIYMVV